MGTIKNFEDLEIWKMPRELVNQIYSDLRKCHDFSFKDQITRAGISSMNNIAEGFRRNSDSEFKQFLNISKGSSGEVKSMYYIDEDQNFIPQSVANEKRERIQILINKISMLMKYLKSGK
jgi:four helix bundle protein